MSVDCSGLRVRTTACVAAFLVAMTLVSCKKEPQEQAANAKIEMTKADDLWKSDKREDAVEVYKTLVNDHLLDLSQSERARALSHVIDFQIKQAGPDAASDYMQTAIRMDVPLSLSTPEANKALASEREKAKHNGSAWTDAAAAEKFNRTVEAMQPKQKSDSPAGSGQGAAGGNSADGKNGDDIAAANRAGERNRRQNLKIMEEAAERMDREAKGR